MIRLRHATGLATTKLRTHKLRLTVTVVVAGLLFGCLVAASLVGRGALGSVASFYNENHGERFMVSATQYTSGDSSLLTRAEVIDRAIAINKSLQAKKSAEAKHLGISYDPTSDKSPYEEVDTPQGKQRSLYLYSSAAQQAMAEYNATHPPASVEQLNSTLSSYHLKALYKGKVLPSGTTQGTLKPLHNGQEDFDSPTSSQSTGQPVSNFVQYWGLISQGLLQPYVFPGASTALGDDGSIPVIAPYSAAQQLAGMQMLPPTARASQQLEQLKQFRSVINNVRFQVCYRNSTSVERINNAAVQQQELGANKNNINYMKPAVIYGTPSKPCEPPSLVSDTRTVAEKKYTASQEAFDELFGKTAPQQQILTFRIVGVSPDTPSNDASTATSLISNVLSSSLSTDVTTWFSPLEIEDKLPTVKQIFTPDRAVPIGTFDRYYAEFSSATSAKSFLSQHNCNQDNIASNGCGQPGRGFVLAAFGGSNMAIDEAQQSFRKALAFAALAVAMIAVIIMMGAIGRIISDSRRETAVFRAMGANKEDIALIYLIYTFLVALVAIAFAGTIGVAVAQIVQYVYSDGLTVQSLVVFNSADLTKKFSLFNVYPPDMLGICGLIIASSLLSTALPLFRNLRRSPILDMRDDS